MKYAVMYYSKTGNTRELAEQIYVSLPESDKQIDEIGKTSDIPTADVYWIGFPVRNMSCPPEIMDTLESIVNAKIALFTTSGMIPSEKYKELIGKRTVSWIDDSCEYLGMFMCQGKTDPAAKERIAAEYASESDAVLQILDNGDSHPDDCDLDNLSEFCERIVGILND